MEDLRVINKKNTKPTAWVHILVVAKKNNNKLRVYMDPRDFPIETVEYVISTMPNAKVFSIVMLIIVFGKSN